jgi:hypothetical protein
VPGYQPPTWPSGAIPKQTHLDLEVGGELDAAEAEAIRLGARRAENSRTPQDGGSCWIRPATRSACATGASRYRLTARSVTRYARRGCLGVAGAGLYLSVNHAPVASAPTVTSLVISGSSRPSRDFPSNTLTDKITCTA